MIVRTVVLIIGMTMVSPWSLPIITVHLEDLFQFQYAVNLRSSRLNRDTVQPETFGGENFLKFYSVTAFRESFSANFSAGMCSRAESMRHIIIYVCNALQMMLKHSYMNVHNVSGFTALQL